MTKEDIVKYLITLDEEGKKHIKSPNRNNSIINKNKTMDLNLFGSKLRPNTTPNCSSILKKRERLKPNKKVKRRIRFNDPQKDHVKGE